MSYLVVPLRVDALVLGKPTEVSGPDFDPSRMPWSGKQGNYNADSPNLPAAANAEPFSDRRLRLSAGTHLHWAFPPGLTHGCDTPTDWMKVCVSEMHFPALPTRFAVFKRVGGKVCDSWLVDSNFGLLDEGAAAAYDDGSDRLAVAYPHDVPNPRLPPFVRLGRQIPIPPDGQMIDHSPRGVPYTRPLLSVVGYGDPSFTALYANCRTAFGCYDTSADISAKVTYDVFGWYPRSAEDPLVCFNAAMDKRHKRAGFDGELRDRLNREENNSLISEDETLSSQMKGEALRLLTQDAFGWRVPEFGLDGLICHGRVIIEPDRETARPGRISVPVALGNTSSEAVAALVAAGRAGVASDKRTRIEEALEALKFAPRLRHNKLDIGTAFNESRHAAGFRTVTEEKLWTVRRSDTGRPSDQDELVLPPDLSRLLDQLNRAQSQYSLARADLESLQRMLYCNWQSWMLARYRRDADATFGMDVNALAALLERLCSVIESEQTRTGKLILQRAHSNQPDKWRAEANGGLASEVVDLLDALDEALLHLAQNTNPKVRLEAARIPGRRFRQAMDPIVALSNPYTRPSPRHTPEAPVEDAPDMPIWQQEIEDAEREDGTLARRLEAALLASVFDKTPAGGESLQGAVNWTPFRVEWLAAVRPLAPKSRTDGRPTTSPVYDPQFITATHDLTSGGHDLRLKKDVPLDNPQQLISGRALATPHADLTLLARIEAHLLGMTGVEARRTVAHFQSQNGVPSRLSEVFERFWMQEIETEEEQEEAADGNGEGDAMAPDMAAFMKKYTEGPLPDIPLVGLLEAYLEIDSRAISPVALPLDGLSAALAGRRATLHRPIDDPMGFAPERALTERIAAAINGLQMPGPTPESASFEPIRSGALDLLALRLVDGFGQHLDIQPDTVITSAPLSRPDTPDSPVLSPRIAQPARVIFDWLPHRDTGVARDHREASPVAGWLVASHVDHGQIMVHDSAGLLLGTVGVDGRWRPAPGPRPMPTSPLEIPDAALAQVVAWLANRSDGPAFIEAFCARIEDALEAIHPGDPEDHALASLLTGRPLAVARARVGIELLGQPLTSASWTELATRVNGARPSTHRFENVQFPIRLGEAQRNADGLVGFWLETGQSGLRAFQNDRFHDPASPEDSGLSVSCSGEALVLTLLLDPRAAVHLTTGILPTARLEIDPVQYRNAMGRIGVTHLAAPVLMPASQVEIPLPPVPANAEKSQSGTRPVGYSTERPLVVSALGGRSFKLGFHPEIIYTSHAFNHVSDPVFWLSGPVGTIDPASGRITLPTDRQLHNVTLTVTMSNHLGQASTDLTVSVTAPRHMAGQSHAKGDAPARVDPSISGDELSGWAWMTREPSGWTETTQYRRIDRDLFRDAFPQQGEMLWKTLHSAGWLQPVGQEPDRPRLVSPSSSKSLRVIGTEAQSRELYATLLRLTNTIGRPQVEARYDETFILTEGWLQLRRKAEN